MGAMSDRKQATPKARADRKNGAVTDKSRDSQRRDVRALAADGARKHARTLDQLSK